MPLKRAWTAIWARPWRSLLLAQGTAWGVGLAILPAAVLEGTRTSARADAARIGADRIAVVRDPTASGGPLQVADVERLEQALGPRVVAVGAVRVDLDARRRAATESAAEVVFLASTPNAPAARGLELASGRWLREDDAATKCLVEAAVAEALGRAPFFVGDEVPGPAGEPLEIVGVLVARTAAQRATDELGFDTRHTAHARVARPILAAFGVPMDDEPWKRSDRCVHRLLPPAEREAAVDWLFLRAADIHDLGALTADVRASPAFEGRPVLCRRSLVLPTLLDPRVERFEAVSWAMFLACLFMGAVAIANLGLLTASTRGEEIALARVEGASRRDIAVQVLAEGLLLAVVGGVCGCLIGAGLAELRVALEPVAGFAWVFPWTRASYALAVALVVGLLAAWVPARVAARQDPAVQLGAA